MPTAPPHLRHDQALRRIFGHQYMMSEFLSGFLPPALLAGWELESLELKHTQWVSRHLRERRGDLVWRLRRHDGSPAQEWAYLYVLTEMQTKPDSRMDLRVLEYVAMFLNSLLNAGEIGRDGQLPAVLPVVLYTGTQPWNTFTSLRQRQRHLPEQLRRFNPALEFLLMDIHRLGPERLRNLGNACTVFFRMAQANDARALPDLVASLNALLPGKDHDTLREAVAQWVIQVRVPALGGRIDQALQQAKTLAEVGIMLAERAPHWLDEARKEARREALQEGRQEGEAKGKTEGAAVLLQAQLQQKFGPLPAWAKAQLAHADTDALQRWALNLLQADRLEAVFNEPT